MSASFLKRSPPPVSPIDGELSKLEALARNGDLKAARRLSEVSTRVKKIIERLPARITKKHCSPSTPTNELAGYLLRTLAFIRAHGRSNEGLILQAKELLPLDRETFGNWWRAAWQLTKDVHFYDETMDALINEIGKGAPSVIEKFEARKSKIIGLVNQKERLAPGIDWAHAPELAGEMTKQYKRASNEWRRYVEKQTKKAALRVWFEN